MKEISPVAPEKLLTFLLEPRSYPHRPYRVRLVQTHVSYLLLAAPYVYKIKKPVNLGFLNFSTLENRRYFSEREVILNRRLCPRIYLEVVPISLTAGRLAFGSGAEVVEFAVKMRKLQDRYFLLRRRVIYLPHSAKMDPRWSRGPPSGAHSYGTEGALDLRLYRV
jgi:uncharacterized protein